MIPSSRTRSINENLQVLWEDGERAYYRRSRPGAAPDRRSVLAAILTAEHPAATGLDRLAREFELRDELDSSWALRPLELVHEEGRTVLVLEDPGGEPLEGFLDTTADIGEFLRLAVAIATALGKLHQRGLVHKDIKPSHIVVGADGEVWLTGFGLASRLRRERQSPEPPETIAGTLAYMAPEQTGRMNRSIDSRSDLYSLGVTLYQLLAGALPFTAVDPMEWVHCHIARQPISPSERRPDVPRTVSAIVMKLLAKTAEERYQTASGLARDLERCLTEWEASGRVGDFPLGARDMPDRLLIAEKLYGREREIAALLGAYQRAVASGTPELVLVTGYSGIGKSSVVSELHKALVPSRGLFASGKFDQYKRDVPYATLAQALQSLIRPLLGASEAELETWRAVFREALGPNAGLMIDLIPQLELIIGHQPPVPEMEPQDAQRRFQLVFRRLIGAFARPEHPLALFLDDLQWLDAATLDVLEDLLTQTDMRNLLLIGAYRDNEVTVAHPLLRKIEVIRQAGGAVEDIKLAPLSAQDTGRLIADSLGCGAEQAAPLAQLVHEKTAGNPFFTIQFLVALAEEGLLALDRDDARWSWDLERIHARGYTDNVVDLMVEKLTRLPAETQRAVQQMACLGHTAEVGLLAILYDNAEQEMHENLREAVRTGLVLHTEHAYRFLHDRVQEAAYSLIPEAERATAHLLIGRLLASRTAPAEIEENIFEIVNQLNRALAIIPSAEEGEGVAELNLIAGRRAKASTAYTSARAYLAIGRGLLAEDAWELNYPLIFALEFHLAECELLSADMATADERLSLLAQRARGVDDIAAVARLRLTLYTTLDRSDRGVEVCLDYLEQGGTRWSPHPTPDEARREYDRIWSLIGDRSVEELIDLPLMKDPASLAALDVLTEVVTPALFTDENLLSLVNCRMVNLSLEHGNSDGSCFAYVWLGMIAGAHFGNYEAGFRFGRLGYDLVEKRGLPRFEARTYMSFGNLVMPWTKHVLAGRDLVRRAFATANRNGDLTFACYSCNNLNTNLLAAGDPLADVEREAENGLAFAQKARFGLVIDIIKGQLGLVRTLRGLTPKFGTFDDEEFDEVAFERRLAGDRHLALPECWYWIRKLQARFLAGDYPSALRAASKAEALLWTSPSFFEVAEYCFYSALSYAAFLDAAAPQERRQHLEALGARYKQLQVWAENCPENFENRAALVGAELARVEGRVLEAEHLYEKAIRSARENGFVHNEAIANEVAGRFYAARGFGKISKTYLRDARHGYLRWGAEGKVRQLDALHPDLVEQSPARPTGTIGTAVEQLDLAAVIKISQAISSEIVLEKLIDTLMRTALESAGAERGLLILPGAELRVEAEAETRGGAPVVQLQPMEVAPDFPEGIVNFVARTGEAVILDDACAEDSFSDPYIRNGRARSVLCLPLLKQGRLVAVLYLENNLAPRVFTPARLAVLKLLASEAAISLENSRLYRDLEEREGRIRRLVDANIIGVAITTSDGKIIEANDAFLRIVGHSRDELMSEEVRWRELSPADRQPANTLTGSEIPDAGAREPFETEYVRRDGSRVPVMVGSANLEEKGHEGVAFVLDLTERKRAEAEAIESERRYRDVETALAHANRVATMGQLAASIAHEVKQPIAAIVLNAQVAQLVLNREPQDAAALQEALEHITKDGNRASDVINRIRALIQKAPRQQDRLEINEVIREMIELTAGEAMKVRVRVKTELAAGLPPIRGDRVQLQQVMLNLIVNALEAMEDEEVAPRELTISTNTAEPGGVLVTVGDLGTGLVPGALERLFEAFYTTKPDGLGLGLSICRSIVEAHGGRLWASANQPRGTVFQFTVPADPDLA
ncbi:MAG TPA: AAA family ATPase [Devosiaceae bacterium]|nr:AAA family ATPase [Devosiaceae bacterium]